MDELFDVGNVAEASVDDIKAVLSTAIAPGESIVWAGRPQPGVIARRALSKALLGLIFITFVLTWMAGVVQGKNNNWDRKRPVGPFAPHNVVVAVLAGLWLLPPGLSMLTSPLWQWRKARGTAYALTGRRALVVEPGTFGGQTVASYGPEDLALLRRDGREDGAGDLVFLHRKTWDGSSKAVGFLAIERAGEVEALLRKSLFAGGRVPGPAPRRAHGPLAGARTYRVSAPVRFYQMAGMAVGVIAGFCLAGNLVGAVVVLVLMPGRALAALAALAAENGWPGPLGVALGLVGALGTLAVTGLVAWLSFRAALTMPTEIALHEDGTIELRSLLRTTRLRAADITSIATGGWGDPGCFQVVLRYEGGRVYLVNMFPDFRDLLATIKDLNPAVEVQGF